MTMGDRWWIGMWAGYVGGMASGHYASALFCIIVCGFFAFVADHFGQSKGGERDE